MPATFEQDLYESLRTLKSGGVILYPTDTLWGLGCDASRGDAVEKIFRIKKRSENKNLIVLVNGLAMLERYVNDIPEAARNILEVSIKPVTIIYPCGRNLTPPVLGNDGSIAIRICNEDFCNELITKFRRPIVSTSANISGNPPPSNFSEIEDNIIKSADYVVEHKRNDMKKNTPSSVILFEKDGSFRIIRQ